jgi:hypothetical protein
MLAATVGLNAEEATATRDSTHANIRIRISPSHDSYERRQVLRAHIRGISTHLVLSYTERTLEGDASRHWQ